MSQSSGMAGEGFNASQSTKANSTGRAVLLLAIAVILGIALLHELDNAPSTAALSSSTKAKAAAPSATTTSALAVQARQPSEVKVLVANGIGTAGIASKVAARLQPAGYILLKPGNTVAKETQSLVEYIPGYQAEAQQVATSLSLPASAVQALPTPAPVQDLQGSHVLVIVGNDLAAQPQTLAANGATVTTVVGTATGAAAGATTTTVNPATSGPLNHLPGVSATSPTTVSGTATTVASH